MAAPWSWYRRIKSVRIVRGGWSEGQAGRGVSQAGFDRCWGASSSVAGGGRSGGNIMALAPTHRAVAPAASASNRCRLLEESGVGSGGSCSGLIRLRRMSRGAIVGCKGGHGGGGSMVMSSTYRAIVPAASALSWCRLLEKAGMRVRRVVWWGG